MASVLSLNRLRIVLKWAPLKIGERVVFQWNDNLKKLALVQFGGHFAPFEMLGTYIQWILVIVGGRFV